MPGIACMVVSGLLLTLNDAAVKALTGTLPVGQIMAIRGLVALALIGLLVVVLRDPGRPRVRHVLGQATRAVTMVLSTFLFVSGLRWLPLADAIALAFLGPVLVTALAPALLAERVGWRRWTGVLIGFCGVLVMLRPGSGGINWAVLLPVGAALAGALRDILTRRIAGTDGATATLFYSTLGVAIAGCCTAPLGWQPLSGNAVVLLAVAGLLLCGAHFLQINSFRLAEAATVVPFKYTSLLWAMLLGLMFWDHVPAPSTLLGAGLVVGSSLYILRRERRRPAALTQTKGTRHAA